MIRRLRYMLGLLLLGGLLLLPAGAVHATDLFSGVCNGSTADSSLCQEAGKSQGVSDNSFYGKNGLLIKVANIITTVAGIAAVVVIIVAGIKYSLSQGDSGQISEAKNTIIYTAVGLVVIVVSRTLIAFVISRVK